MARKRTIGVLSRQTNVKVTTIRYYESIGLLSAPDRTDSGQRIYETEAVERLNFIRHARELGFPMFSIRELIDLQDNPAQDCGHVDEIANRQLSDVRNRISQLKALEAELERMVDACAGGSVASCKVLETLGDHNQCADAHPPRQLGQHIGSNL